MGNLTNPCRYVACFLATALILVLISLGLSWLFGPLSGDLTRIGNWSERDFGPNYEQLQAPTNTPTFAQSEHSPKLIVLGDSFSHPNIWQFYFSQSSKLPTYSYQYKDVGCIDNWLKRMASSDTSGTRTVVMQVAERSFVAVFRNERSCASEAIRIRGQDMREVIAKGARLDLDASYLFQTAINSVRMQVQRGRLLSGGVVNVQLSSGELFSNKVSNRLLYYAEDDNKTLWRQGDIEAAIENLQKIKKRLAGLNARFLLVIVPDKSTVYRPFMREGASMALYPDVFSSVSAAGIDTVDLQGVFGQKVNAGVDLYLPNDTHLGEAGYKLMGDAVANAIQRKPGGGVP